MNAKEIVDKFKSILLSDVSEEVKETPVVAEEVNLEEQASYPNCCYNKTGQLVVCYTSYSRGINSGSRIAVATLSKKYSKIISTKYIDFDMLNNLEGI